MSVILLITSGLLIRAVWRVQAIDPGFIPRERADAQTALPRPKYDNPVRRVQFYDRVLARVRALPGVQSAAFTSGLPMVDHRSRHRGRDSRPGKCSDRAQRRRQPSLGHAAVFQDDGDSACSAAVMWKTATAATVHGSPSSARRSPNGTGPARIRSAGRSGISDEYSNGRRRRRRRQGPRVGADQRAPDVPAGHAGPGRIPRRLRPEGAGDSPFGSGGRDRLGRPPDRPRRRSRAADLRRACNGRHARGRDRDADGASCKCSACSRSSPSCSRQSESTGCWPTRSRSGRRRSAYASRWARIPRASGG